MTEFDSISEAFRAIREEHCLSQRELSLIIGTSRVTVLNIESGKTECSSYVILRLMEIFKFRVKVDIEPMRRKFEEVIALKDQDEEMVAIGASKEGFQ